MKEICAIRGCVSRCEDNHGFCTKCADKIFAAATSQIDQVLEVASKVYFGRSAHPERRLLEHHVKAERDHLMVLHWSAHWDEIAHFEESLIKCFKKDAKYKRVENESSFSEGSRSGAWNALYVSFALKSAIRWIPGAVVVDQLHWRNRLWPDQIVPNTPVLLRCDLSEKEASAELERFKRAAQLGKGIALSVA